MASQSIYLKLSFAKDPSAAAKVPMHSWSHYFYIVEVYKMAFQISQVSMQDEYSLNEIDSLLKEEGIKKDQNLDYISAMYDNDYHIIATGSCFRNTLRCLAISKNHQGEGLLNQLVTHLMEVQFGRGNLHLFLYSKLNSAKFFRDLGFYEISRVEDGFVFMENKKNAFKTYLKALEKTRQKGRSAALVMNANPFTLGHQYLVETAAGKCDTLHLFVLSEDASLVPFRVRKHLVKEGTSHLSNVVIHESGSYIISNATFPTYFLKDESQVIEEHARLDINIFIKIAAILNISERYVGEEPFSQVTGIYNQIMAEELPKAGISCIIVPRKEVNGLPVSASTVRKLIKDGDIDAIRPLVPQSTYDFFLSPEGKEVCVRIRQSDDVIHY